MKAIHLIYRHHKTQQEYQLIDIAIHSETREEMVVYKALYNCPNYGYGKLWVRPKKMFFEKVFYCNEWVSRFKLIDTADNDSN